METYYRLTEPMTIRAVVTRELIQEVADEAIGIQTTAAARRQFHDIDGENG